MTNQQNRDKLLESKRKIESEIRGFRSLQETLGNLKWLSENEDKIKNMLPKTWTHINNINGLQIGFQLKLLGVDWHSEKDFGNIMVYLEKIGMMIRTNKYQVKFNPERVMVK